ncbi:hypothetical protein BELL_0019g00150 [Botrytis elliptica]|uniref:Uncharacterized protein n=1 Tax=Botrytis elliptica TaxID=278938 RepID=A0A4Z1KES6_9HELO|nr:hypothetical protein BELL_0019g00150 [Botrytis elliptica]
MNSLIGASPAFLESWLQNTFFSLLRLILQASLFSSRLTRAYNFSPDQLAKRGVFNGEAMSVVVRSSDSSLPVAIIAGQATGVGHG